MATIRNLDTVLSVTIERHRSKIIFAIFSVVGLGLALYTNHAWEDFYITFRSSKNLALGNGLVFQIGERVHTFTSPLNVLLPALFSWISGNTSDALVLWLYRLCCIFIFSGTGVLLYHICRALGVGRFSTFFILGMVLFEIKMVDFTINGQEVAFMLFFTSVSILPYLKKLKHPEFVLGVSWAGLMWSRPDGFIYAMAIGWGFFLFSGKGVFWNSKSQLLKSFFRAAFIGGLIYVPWFAWAWWYYGSPVPHTIVAKAVSVEHNWIQFIIDLVKFPVTTLFQPTSMEMAFTPVLMKFSGWPMEFLIFYSPGLCWIASFIWLIPIFSRSARALSFAAMCTHIYLTLIVKNFYHWYLPASGLLSLIAFVMIFHQLFILLQKSRTRLLIGNYRFILLRIGQFVAVAMLLCNTTTFLFSAYQLKIQQDIIETGVRKKIGLWLNENARTKKDTVFLECLGYIGYFSQLKMLDFPGLSSPEVVESRGRLNTDRYDLLINDLKPDWLVLRPWEVNNVMQGSPGLLKANYELKLVVDAGPAIDKLKFLPGRGYLNFDRKFLIFTKKLMI